MSQIGLQLYTIKGEFERDPRGILKKVAGMGYGGVEFYGNYAGLAMLEIRRELDLNGLKAAGCVVDMEKLTDDAALLQAIKDCGVLGTDVIVCPWINDDRCDCAERCRATARALDRAGKICREHGVTFLYHIHGYEFEDYGGTNLMKILLEETDPASFNLEVDVYWVEDGGQDAMSFLLANWDRTVYLHLKDMRDRETKHDIEVGEGVIDIRGIIALAVRRGCPWLIVEQEMFDMPVLDSAARSFRNIREIMAGLG